VVVLLGPVVVTLVVVLVVEVEPVEVVVVVVQARPSLCLSRVGCFE
jgi:hypothetical protein